MDIRGHVFGYAMLGVVVLALVTIFGVSANALLPLVFLACPVMMFFMMRSMNSGDKNDSSKDVTSSKHEHDHSD